MKKLLRNVYLRGYMDAFSLYPTGENDDPWEDIRLAYEEVGFDLWCSFLEEIPELEKHTRGTENERKAQELAKSVRKTCERLGV